MKYAYITCITNEEFVDGVAVLNESIKRCFSQYPLYVLIPDNSEEISNKLDQLSIRWIPVNFEAPFSYGEYKDNHLLNRYYSFIKLNACKLIQFDKVILLDADLLICKNIDHLFESPHYSAAIAGKTLHPDWVDLCCGLLVIEPSEHFYKSIIDYIPKCVELKSNEGYHLIGDHDIWSSYDNYFWRKRTDLCIHEKYQVLWHELDDFCKINSIKKQDIFVVHFEYSPKPWLMNKKEYRHLIASLIKHRRIIQLLFLFKYKKILRRIKKLRYHKNKAVRII